MRFLFVMLVLVLSAGSAQAKSCYSQAEAEAENAIRIHSELMVIGLNCQHMTPRGWKNFYQEYREITARHANQTSTDSAKMRPDVFCSTYAPRIPKVGQMSRQEFMQWASSSSNGRSTKPLCAGY